MNREEYKLHYMEDVNAHKSAESITTQVLNNLNNGFVFDDVSMDSKYFTLGDIKMQKKGHKTKYIDVKDDDRIKDTGNFHVESGGYSKIYGTKKKGWIDSNYDYVAVISQDEGIIWILSFKRLKEVYKDTDLTHGRKVTSDFWDNVKYGYTIPISSAIELGVVLAKIEYEFDDLWEEYMPTDYKSKNKLKAS